MVSLLIKELSPYRSGEDEVAALIDPNGQMLFSIILLNLYDHHNYNHVMNKHCVMSLQFLLTSEHQLISN